MISPLVTVEVNLKPVLTIWPVVAPASRIPHSLTTEVKISWVPTSKAFNIHLAKWVAEERMISLLGPKISTISGLEVLWRLVQVPMLRNWETIILLTKVVTTAETSQPKAKRSQVKALSVLNFRCPQPPLIASFTQFRPKGVSSTPRRRHPYQQIMQPTFLLIWFKARSSSTVEAENFSTVSWFFTPAGSSFPTRLSSQNLIPRISWRSSKRISAISKTWAPSTSPTTTSDLNNSEIWNP